MSKEFFEKLHHRVAETEALQKSGKVRRADVLAEIEQAYRVKRDCPSDDELLAYVEDTLSHDHKLRADQHVKECALCRCDVAELRRALLTPAPAPAEQASVHQPPVVNLLAWLREAYRQIQDLQARTAQAFEHASVEVAADATETVARNRPRGLIPASFVRPDGGSDQATVEVLQMPAWNPGGRLVIGIRIPEQYCPSRTAEVAVLAAPSGTVIAPPETKQVGEILQLLIEVPPELRSSLQKLLQEAAGDTHKLEWAKLPLRFVVRSLPPPQEKFSAASEEDAVDQGILSSGIRSVCRAAAYCFRMRLQVFHETILTRGITSSQDRLVALCCPPAARVAASRSVPRNNHDDTQG